MLFTVARPCGILTRFPILPAFIRDTQTHLKELWNVAVPESKRKLPRATLEVKMFRHMALIDAVSTGSGSDRVIVLVKWPSAGIETRSITFPVLTAYSPLL